MKKRAYLLIGLLFLLAVLTPQNEVFARRTKIFAIYDSVKQKLFFQPSVLNLTNPSTPFLNFTFQQMDLHAGLLDFASFVWRNVEKIRENGALVFDIDRTLLYKIDDLEEIVEEELEGELGSDNNIVKAVVDMLERDQVEIATDLLAELLIRGFKIALISGNDVNVQKKRLVEPLVAKLQQRGALDKLENFYLYANGGATKVKFDFNEGKLEVKRFPDYDELFKVEKKKLDDVKKFIEDYVHEGKLYRAYKQHPQLEQYDDKTVQSALKSAFENEVFNYTKKEELKGLVKCNTDWIDDNPAEFHLTVISADLLDLVNAMFKADIDQEDNIVKVGGKSLGTIIETLEENSNLLKEVVDIMKQLKQARDSNQNVNIDEMKNNLFNKLKKKYNEKEQEVLEALKQSMVTGVDGFWLELRTGEVEINKRKEYIVVQMTIKRLPSKFRVDGNEIKLGKDVRNKIIDAMEEEGLHTTLKAAFRPGGSTSIDIGADKSGPLQDLQTSLGLTNRYILYFGDELVYRGNDIPVIKVPEVRIYSPGRKEDAEKAKKQDNDIMKQIEKYLERGQHGGGIDLPQGVSQQQYVDELMGRIHFIGNTPVSTWDALRFLLQISPQSQTQGGTQGTQGAQGGTPTSYLPQEEFAELCYA